MTSYASLYFCLLAGADIEQAEDEEALDYEHEAPRSTYFADLADDSSDDTDDDEITGSAPGTPPDSHSSRQPSRDLDSAPPSRSPSRSPSVESIQRPMPRGPVQPLQLALGLWLERSGASRQDYIRLREVFPMKHTLSTDNPEFELPAKLDTLKRQVRGHLPMLRLLRKAVPVVVQKQASLPSDKKKLVRIERRSWIYWYDPIDLVATILSAHRLTSLMHFGMAIAVDEPTEFYHSRCWASSNLSTSGEFARSTQGELIMVGDIVSSRLRKASPEVEFSSYSGRHSQVP